MNRNTESQHEISPRKDDEGQILDLRGMNLTDDEAGKSFWEEPAASYVSKSLQTCVTFRSGPCRHIAVVWAQGNCPNIGESIWDPSKRCGRRDWPSNERKFFCPSSTSIVRWQERRRSRSPRGGLNTRRISSVPWQDLTTCLMCENYAGVSFLQISPFFFWGTLCPREIPVPWWWMVWMERLTLKSNKKRPQISRILRTPWVPQILCWYMLILPPSKLHLQILSKSITFAAIIDTSHWMSLTRKFLRFSRNSKTQSFWHPGSTNQKGWKWTMVPLSWTIWWKSGVADKAFNLSRDSLGNFANVETWDYGNYRSVRVRILKVLTVWLYFDCGSGLTKEDILDSVNAHMFQDSNTRALRYSVTDSWPTKVIPLNAQDSSVRCVKPCVP